MPPPRKPLLTLDAAVEESVSMTWRVDPKDGSISHAASGLKISQTEGVVFEGSTYSLRPDEIEIDVGMELGRGAGGCVQRGRHKPTGMALAVKSIRIESKEKKEQLLNEIKGLINAQGCEQLVQWYAAFVSSNAGTVHVALELMDRGSLADLKRKLSVTLPEEILAGTGFMFPVLLMHDNQSCF